MKKKNENSHSKNIFFILALNILDTIQTLRVDDDDELNVQCDVYEEELNADNEALENMQAGKVNLNDHMSVFNAIFKRVSHLLHVTLTV